MEALPTKRQLYWILAIAGILTVIGANGGIAVMAGYFSGQVVVLGIILTVAKAIRGGFNKIRGATNQADA